MANNIAFESEKDVQYELFDSPGAVHDIAFHVNSVSTFFPSNHSNENRAPSSGELQGESKQALFDSLEKYTFSSPGVIDPENVANDASSPVIANTYIFGYGNSPVMQAPGVGVTRLNQEELHDASLAPASAELQQQFPIFASTDAEAPHLFATDAIPAPDAGHVSIFDEEFDSLVDMGAADPDTPPLVTTPGTTYTSEHDVATQGVPISFVLNDLIANGPAMIQPSSPSAILDGGGTPAVHSQYDFLFPCAQQSVSDFVLPSKSAGVDAKKITQPNLFPDTPNWAVGGQFVWNEGVAPMYAIGGPPPPIVNNVGQADAALEGDETGGKKINKTTTRAKRARKKKLAAPIAAEITGNVKSMNKSAKSNKCPPSIGILCGGICIPSRTMQSCPQPPAQNGKAGPSQPSRFCHICLRRAERVSLISCANLQTGACRKVVCEKCFDDFGWDWENAIRSDVSWACTHCREE